MSLYHLNKLSSTAAQLCIEETGLESSKTSAQQVKKWVSFCILVRLRGATKVGLKLNMPQDG